MRQSRAKSAFLVLAVILATYLPLSGVTVAAAADQLSTNSYISQGQYLESTHTSYYHDLTTGAVGHGFYLKLQDDGNLVMYAPAPTGFGVGRAIWWTGTTNGYYLKMQGDGNLVLYTSNWQPTGWDAHTQNPGSSNYAKVQNDGNFVVNTSGNVNKWNSSTWQGDDTASLNPTGVATCWVSPGIHLCRNTWTGPGTEMYFRAVDHLSSSHPEWATPESGAIAAWNMAAGPQNYSTTAHTNDTWIFLEASAGNLNGVTGVNGITWNCFQSNGGCIDADPPGTVYYSFVFLNEWLLPMCSPDPCSLGTNDTRLVQNVIAHESGHAMLLGHSPLLLGSDPTDSSALMWPRSNTISVGPSAYEIGNTSYTPCQHGGFGMTCIYGY